MEKALTQTIFKSLFFFLVSTQLFTQTKQNDLLPTLYVISQKNCRPCIMMEPIINDIKRLYKSNLNIVVFKKRSKERSKLLKHFFQKLDLRFTPTFLLVNKNLDLLSYGKGYIPKQEFLKIVKDGLEKFKKLQNMQIDRLYYICDNTLKFCQATKKHFSKYISSLKNKPNITEINMNNYKTKPQWDNFYKTMKKFKYLYGWEAYPAIIASTKNNEVVHFIQKEFDQKQLQQEFKSLLQ